MEAIMHDELARLMRADPDYAGGSTLGQGHAAAETQ